MRWYHALGQPNELHQLSMCGWSSNLFVKNVLKYIWHNICDKNKWTIIWVMSIGLQNVPHFRVSSEYIWNRFNIVCVSSKLKVGCYCICHGYIRKGYIMNIMTANGNTSFTFWDEICKIDNISPWLAYQQSMPP